MNKLILLNGPPRSGKDTIANKLLSSLSNDTTLVSHLKISSILKDMAHRLYHITYESSFIFVEHDYFESTKDLANEKFFNKTPRQIYIGLSELYLKSIHGQDILGLLLKSKIEKIIKDNQDKYKDLIFIISDCGFSEETIPLTELFYYEDCHLFRIFRENTSFDIDSRSYLNNIEFGKRNSNQFIKNYNLHHEENKTDFAVDWMIEKMAQED